MTNKDQLTIRAVLDKHRSETWNTGWNNNATEEALKTINDVVLEIIGDDYPEEHNEEIPHMARLAAGWRNNEHEIQRERAKQLIGKE